MTASMKNRSLPASGADILLPALITLAIFVGLPMADYFHQPEKTSKLFDLDLAEPPSPPPPAPHRKAKQENKLEIPKPKLAKRQRLMPLRAALRLDLILGEVAGDFKLDFQVLEPEIEPSLQDDVFELSDLDFPPQAVDRTSPLYPPRARMKKTEGEVRLEFIVDIDGTVRNAEVTTSRPEGVFDAAALRAVRRWRFKPGVKGDQPVPVRVRQTLQFTLESRTGVRKR